MKHLLQDLDSSIPQPLMNAALQHLHSKEDKDIIQTHVLIMRLASLRLEKLDPPPVYLFELLSENVTAREVELRDQALDDTDDVYTDFISRLSYAAIE